MRASASLLAQQRCAIRRTRLAILIIPCLRFVSCLCLCIVYYSPLHDMSRTSVFNHCLSSCGHAFPSAVFVRTLLFHANSFVVLPHLSFIFSYVRYQVEVRQKPLHLCIHKFNIFLPLSLSDASSFPYSSVPVYPLISITQTVHYAHMHCERANALITSLFTPYEVFSYCVRYRITVIVIKKNGSPSRIYLSWMTYCSVQTGLYCMCSVKRQH